MKKFLSCLLALLMTASLLVGCGQQQTDAPGNDEPDQPALADGVYTADPRIVPTARRIPVIDYESMLEMSSCGSKVLALRCVEYAQRFGMPLHVRSSFSHRRGTLIVPEGVDPRTLPNI